MNILKPHKARLFENYRERKRKITSKGSANRRVISTKTVGGRERQYHATKGWRVRAVSGQ